ncbi:hypothetical protein HOU11_gp04 [Pectobacterium phage Gaspode]|uniref:Uncharacterized protein n=1 Tax=Pectobacterium phage Gaspode TaxID=2320194 RepID=A0A385IF79_9CAUD|nr:hypothetical protein HOU11_gp04 [Pectobacterium phage Gaspode]AXY81661.1 hypothetical protein [Pectobacterium phage Gaspode]
MSRVVHAEQRWRVQSRPHWKKRILALEASLVRYKALPVLTAKQQAAVSSAVAEIKRLQLPLKVQK